MYNVVHKTNGKEKVIFEDKEKPFWARETIKYSTKLENGQETFFIPQSTLEIMRNDLLCSGKIELTNTEKKDNDWKARRYCTRDFKNCTCELLVGFVVCSSKKYVELKTTHTTYKKECHKDDEFDWKIGLGLAYSLFDSANDYGKIGVDINDYRNTIIEKEKGKVVKKYKELDYVSYSMKMLKTYLKHGDFDYNDFVTRVDEALKVKKDFYVSFKNYKNDLNKIIKKEEK